MRKLFAKIKDFPSRNNWKQYTHFNIKNEEYILKRCSPINSINQFANDYWLLQYSFYNNNILEKKRSTTNNNIKLQPENIRINFPSHVQGGVKLTRKKKIATYQKHSLWMETTGRYTQKRKEKKNSQIFHTRNSV